MLIAVAHPLLWPRQARRWIYTLPPNAGLQLCVAVAHETPFYQEWTN